MTTTEGAWGVWITQGPKLIGNLPRSYWWQGPAYRGDHLMTQAVAEREARRLNSLSPTWRYEARPYVSPSRSGDAGKESR